MHCYENENAENAVFYCCVGSIQEMFTAGYESLLSYIIATYHLFYCTSYTYIHILICTVKSGTSSIRHLTVLSAVSAC